MEGFFIPMGKKCGESKRNGITPKGEGMAKEIPTKPQEDRETKGRNYSQVKAAKYNKRCC